MHFNTLSIFCCWKQTGIVKNFLYRNNENMVKENIENKFIYIFYRALKSLLLVSCMNCIHSCVYVANVLLHGLVASIKYFYTIKKR